MKTTKPLGVFEHVYDIVNKQEFVLGNVQELIELSVYSALAFFVPMFLSHYQFITGAVVNAALVLAAYNLKGIKLLPVILFPSLGVLAGGFMFGSMTHYILFMIPFIWLGNAALVFIFKWFQLVSGMRFLIVLWIAAAAKTAAILGAAFILISLTAVPSSFISMGMLQVFTALIGGASAFAVQKGKSMFLGKK